MYSLNKREDRLPKRPKNVLAVRFKREDWKDFTMLADYSFFTYSEAFSHVLREFSRNADKVDSWPLPHLPLKEADLLTPLERLDRLVPPPGGDLVKATPPMPEDSSKMLRISLGGLDIMIFRIIQGGLRDSRGALSVNQTILTLWERHKREMCRVGAWPPKLRDIDQEAEDRAQAAQKMRALRLEIQRQDDITERQAPKLWQPHQDRGIKRG